MGFLDILKGVIIAFVGGVLILFGLGEITFPTFLQMYGFPDLGVLFLPIGIVDRDRSIEEVKKKIYGGL